RNPPALTNPGRLLVLADPGRLLVLADPDRLLHLFRRAVPPDLVVLVGPNMQRVGKSQAPLFRLPPSLVPPLLRIRLGFSGLVTFHRQLGDIRRASLRVSFVVLCVIVLCVPVVRLGGNTWLLGVVKKPTPSRVGIAIAEKAVLSNCGRCDCNADAQGQTCRR